jgi:hypothetical protein
LAVLDAASLRIADAPTASPSGAGKPAALPGMKIYSLTAAFDEDTAAEYNE